MTPFFIINIHMNTFQQFFAEAKKLVFDTGNAKKIEPFWFGRHLVPEGGVTELYKVPFDMSKLSPPTQKNIEELIKKKGFIFAKWMFVSPREMERGTGGLFGPIGITDAIVYSIFIPCKNAYEQECMYARLRYNVHAAGQTRIWHKDKSKQHQLKHVPVPPWEWRLKKAKERGDQEAEIDIAGEMF